MPKIQITLEIDEDDLHAYEFEAKRAEKSVETILEEVVQGLYRELKQEEKEGDHEILFP